MQFKIILNLVKKALEASNSKDDKFTALNNAAFNSGVFIHIPRNLILDKPIHFLTCLSEDGHSTISRNIIFADESSKATIVQELYSPKTESQQAYLEFLSTMPCGKCTIGCYNFTNDGSTCSKLFNKTNRSSTRCQS